MYPQIPVAESEDTLPIIAQGKTKTIYSIPHHEHLGRLVLVQNSDNITAQDGLRRRVVPGKGRVSCQITTLLFNHLGQQGIPNHLIAPKKGVSLGQKYFEWVNRLAQNTDVSDLHFNSSFFARQLDMQPYEFVVRRIAAGSYLKRNPRTESGTRFEEPVVEVFFKDDEFHDPLVMLDSANRRLLLFRASEPMNGKNYISDNPIPYQDLEKVASVFSKGKEIALKAFLILEELFARCNITLVDFKIEVGINSRGDVILSDVITPDEMRLWPNGDKSLATDKQRFRDTPDDQLTPEMLASLLADYQSVLNAVRAALGEPDPI